MTRIQQVLLEVTMDYIGHPYYVSGNAIYHALAGRAAADVHRHLYVSHGMFTPGQFGTYPATHSQSGAKPYMGASLAPVEAYDDLFLFRDPTHQWLLDSRPRDALNVHDIRRHSGNLSLAHETIVGRPEDARADAQTTKWYVQAYIHSDEPDVFPLDETALDGLQLGGQRNYGYGTTQLADTQTVDLDELDYSRLDRANAYLLELMTPFVLTSEYPDTNDVDVPWWWAVDKAEQLRQRTEKVIEDCEAFDLVTIDHRQVIKYAGDRPIETARKGITRVGTHSKYGFGELRVRPLEDLPDESTR